MMNTEHFVFLCLHLSEGQQLDFDQSNKNASFKKGSKNRLKSAFVCKSSVIPAVILATKADCCV